ncbi:MAG TPA: ShlB/FhaC/HecB family hemolysin secretion/activation protein [Limnobacter sp.]|uniref:ShlB/FhaC/HecB family hemolysin secretion/activation protein n=1 Tax=Limnobacter sp. TaxID=2003368 RepID=UPI002E375A36|nr:ShlB/FhaC/HecB family hemolysin secretion/activation protein [Limnobacter sp.]HEX5485253.1 ShlB/FhaC/HecB family hemolysin secretion/activation protein [Limnobacter sp.]
MSKYVEARRVFAGLILSTFAAFSNAQTPSQFLNAEPLPTKPVPSKEAELPAQPVQPEIAKPLDDIHVDVSRFEVVGAPADALPEIQKRLAPFTGTGKTFEDLSNAARVVSAYLQSEKGLYLAYAYLPAQKISNGVIRINVLPGILERVEINWPEKPLRVDREIVQAHLAALKPGSVIHVAEVERVVFLLNDLRGIHVNFAVRPGDTPGTAILVASPSSTRAVSGKVSIDANGSRFAGTYRGIATVNVDSPLGRGDSLALSQLHSDTGGLDFTLLGYTLPLGANGLKIGINASTVHYKLSEQDFPLGLNGDARSLGAFALYPLRRSRNFNLFGLVGFDQKHFTDRQDLAGTETSKQVDAYKLGLSGDSRDDWMGGGINFFDFDLEQSTIKYPDLRPAGLDDDSRTKKFNYSAGRLQSLLKDDLQLWTYLRGQKSLDNLDTTDQCELGGASGVRAFAQGESSGDDCLLATIELRHFVSVPWLGIASREVSANLFYDYGRTRFRHDAGLRPVSFQNFSILAGYGFGLVWERPDQFNFNMSLAFEDRGVRRSDPQKRSPRIFAAFTYYF